MEFLNSELFKKLKKMKDEKEFLANEVEALSEKRTELETSIDTCKYFFNITKYFNIIILLFVKNLFHGKQQINLINQKYFYFILVDSKFGYLRDSANKKLGMS